MYKKTVYIIATCEDFPKQLDGSMYDSDGNPGSATGYDCPYENECPFECNNCNESKGKLNVFKDKIKRSYVLNNSLYIKTENCRLNLQLRKDVFFSKEIANKLLKKGE